MLKHLFASLYWKISVFFLLLLLVMGAIYAYFTLFAVEMYVQEATQKVSAPLAQRIVDKVIMFREGQVNQGVAEEVFLNSAMLNPGIEIYLLDPEGEIVASSAPAEQIKRKKISLEPVNGFIQIQGSAFTLGDDPQSNSRQKVFTAAPVIVEGRLQGYVYAILRGAEYDSAVEMLQDSYILRYGQRLLLLSLIAAAVLGLFVLRLLMRKLRRMQKVVRAFEQGDLEQRIPVRSSDELDQLAASFNSMAATTRRNLEEIRKTDTLRRELVANISHDLRTPLASIQGYVETLLLKEKTLSPYKKEAYLEIILESTQKLSRLVEQLFELSKLDANQALPNREPLALPDLVQDIAQKFYPAAEKLGVDLLIADPDAHTLVYADIGMIERALQNLIENALHFTPEGGIIQIEVWDNAETVSVRVTDTGCGIAPEDLPHIFDRFYQADKSRPQDAAGAGLGLAIAKKIIEMHGGSISVESKMQVGASFRFDLPIYSRAPANRQSGLVERDLTHV